MKILLISTSFNSFTQRTYVDLGAEHDVTVEFGHRPDIMREAVDLFEPDLILCPFLKQAVPEDIWKNHPTIIMHPGIIGDRGPSSIDWAIMEERSEWGMTALEADAEMDAGAVWSTHNFALPLAPKSYVYRALAAEAGMKGISEVVEKLKALRAHAPKARATPAAKSAYADTSAAHTYSRSEYSALFPLLASDNSNLCGSLRPSMKQTDRRIDWARDDTQTIVRKIHAADGFPGVLDRIFDHDYFMFGAHFEDELGTTSEASPGEILAVRHGAICRRTADGAVWITHLKRKGGANEYFKLPATMALPPERFDGVPISSVMTLSDGNGRRTFKEIHYVERNDVGYLFWEFYNGAMSTEQCERLAAAIRAARLRPTKVLAFMGGRNFWSNGIHLNVIEAASDPALESWRNINAMDDVVQEILTVDDRLTISAIGANAGAGGVMLALAADRIFVRDGVILNPHYKAMGLHGSEYWTYSLPKRVGRDRAMELTNACLPINAEMALMIGMVDAVLEGDADSFRLAIESTAAALAQDKDYTTILARKRAARASDEAEKPLSLYRHEELSEMWNNFWGAGSDYHLARRNFVHKIDCSRAPSRIAKHRLGFGDVPTQKTTPACRSEALETVPHF